MKTTAIVTYVDDAPWQLDEFSWLYKSWLFSNCRRTSDIIVFCHPTIASELPDHAGIRIIPYVPLTERESMWSCYGYINSIEYLCSPEAEKVVDGYDYVLRTDNDVFLTEHFTDLRPRLPLFGSGSYVMTEEVARKLSQIARKLELNYAYVHNVGSTILATPDYVIAFSKRQLKLCRYLATNEFSEEGGWPGWFRGVITMYAGELAANDLFGIGISRMGLDCMSMSDESIGSTDFHIHAFHTHQDFSKIAWREGKYASTDLSKLDLTKINEYCLFIAQASVEQCKEYSRYSD